MPPSVERPTIVARDDLCGADKTLADIVADFMNRENVPDGPTQGRWSLGALAKFPGDRRTKPLRARVRPLPTAPISPIVTGRSVDRLTVS